MIVDAKKPKPEGRRRLPAQPSSIDVSLLSSERLWLALVAVAALFAACHTLFDPDLWFHLRVGQEIASGHGIPRIDRLSYPSAGRAYVDLHWLYQLVTYGAFRAFGIAGVTLLEMAMTLGTALGLYRLARRGAGPAIAGVLTILGIVLLSDRLRARPESWSFLLLVATQLVSVDSPAVRRWARVLTPLLIALWVNVEGLFVLGLVVLGARALESPRDRWRWITLGIASLAALLNPYGLEGALHPLLLFSRVNQSLPLYSQSIGEFISPFQRGGHLAITLFPWYLALIGVLLLLRGRRPRWTELLLLGAFIYLAVSARRNVALLPLVATPILARWAEDLRAAPWAKRLAMRISRGLRFELAQVALFAALAFSLRYDWALVASHVQARADMSARFGFGLAPCAYPTEAARFVERSGISGPLFSTIAASDYLLFALPSEPSFIDGRLEVHSAEHFDRYARLLRGGEAWRNAVTEFGFRCLVLPLNEAAGVITEVSRDSTWAWVHLDDTAAVFVRRDLLPPGMPEVARETCGVPAWNGDTSVPSPGLVLPALLDPRSMRIPWPELNLAQLCLSVGWPERAVSSALSAVRIAPRQAAARTNLGTALTQVGRADLAVTQLETALRLPMIARLRGRTEAALGLALLAAKRPGEAIAHLDRALARSTAPEEQGPALVQRGTARAQINDPAGAVQDITRGLNLYPAYLDGYRVLGMIEARRGNTSEARRALETYLRNGGTDATARAALERLGSP